MTRYETLQRRFGAQSWMSPVEQRRDASAPDAAVELDGTKVVLVEARPSPTGTVEQRLALLAAAGRGGGAGGGQGRKRRWRWRRWWRGHDGDDRGLGLRLVVRGGSGEGGGGDGGARLTWSTWPAVRAAAAAAERSGD